MTPQTPDIDLDTIWAVNYVLGGSHLDRVLTNWDNATPEDIIKIAGRISATSQYLTDYNTKLKAVADAFKHSLPHHPNREVRALLLKGQP